MMTADRIGLPPREEIISNALMESKGKMKCFKKGYYTFNDR